MFWPIERFWWRQVEGKAYIERRSTLLRIFATVVESKGFTAAQVNLNISVSSISTISPRLRSGLGFGYANAVVLACVDRERSIIYRESDASSPRSTSSG